ncbi:hypothetical protein DERF_005963 [Dermatophagoides farinae]|uniref:Uncharacterized protein n=1 Tax=Dermatophagoides farinae TaxID=6954 RepID=A0A922L764_DERFA|nr:hypothetical protein DERF_005963 [Dermatophagoides farinae]
MNENCESRKDNTDENEEEINIIEKTIGEKYPGPGFNCFNNCALGDLMVRIKLKKLKGGQGFSENFVKDLN